jgi:hypothetical protein
MSEHIRSILAVVVLTIAIWVWADLELSGPGEGQMPVLITVPGNYMVRKVEPEQLFVKFEGPRGEIQRLLATPADRICRFDLKESDLKKADPKTGLLTLQARDGFKQWTAHRIGPTEIRSTRANLPDGEIRTDQGNIPDGEIRVVVDRVVTWPVPVKPEVTGAKAVAVTALPHDVTARVAASDLAKLKEGERFAVATLAVTAVPENLQVEREVSLDRKLGGPNGVDATFDPPIVKVTASLEPTTATKSVTLRLPILISAPPEVLAKYRIVFQPQADHLIELEVQGSGPDFERLTPQDVRLQLVLSADDKPDPASWIPGKLVVVGLPPGAKLAKPLPTVNFNLEKLPDKPPAP